MIPGLFSAFDTKRRYKSAIHNVQGAFLDVERGFSDGFA
jgi:hypothetical protein